MNKLSKRSLNLIVADYRKAFGLLTRFMDVDGRFRAGEKTRPMDEWVVIRQARAHAVQEAVRWGDPYSFFIAPGVISWVVPVVDGYTLLGAMLGGEVLAETDSEDWGDAVAHLVRHGAAPEEARSYLASLPVWPQARCQEAAERLHRLVYQITGLTPALVHEQQARSQQQRQIAEEIHRRKLDRDRHSHMDEEQVLLSLIRAGDRKGARKILNQMLGRVFLRSANLTIIRALMIEMMGYLVRRAVEDSPFLEPIMEKNHQWMARIIEVEDFEMLAAVVRQALDDFMNNVYEMGYTASHPRVRAAMEYLSANYRDPVTLEQVATAVGLSTFRIAHLVKEETGRSIIRHLHVLRIQEAQRLLEETDRECVDIAMEVGFCDQSYFTRQFRKYTGVTPVRYRRMRHGLRRATGGTNIAIR